MADFAGKNGIKVKGKLATDANIIIADADLNSLDSVIQSYIGKAGGNSKATDWQGVNPKPLGLSAPPLNEIRYKYLHMSANYDSPELGGLIYPLAPRFGWFNSRRKRYEFNG